MSQDANSKPPTAGPAGTEISPKAQKSALLKLPGLIVISFYMLLLAGEVVLSVVQGRAGTLVLIFPAFFIAGGLGLTMLLRWAWALTLSAVVLGAGWCLWTFSTQHNAVFLAQGLLNLVFFLYLVRPEVRTKLR